MWYHDASCGIIILKRITKGITAPKDKNESVILSDIDWMKTTLFAALFFYHQQMMVLDTISRANIIILLYQLPHPPP